MENKTILVNGLGNIGTSLVNLLLHYQTELGINKIYAAKRTFHEWNRAELAFLAIKGVELVCLNKDTAQREDLLFWEDILEEIDYIFEATANGVGLSNLARYQSLTQLKGACAQGSEKGFGIPFMAGVNEEQVKGKPFVQIVSCNTHGSAALLNAIAGDQLDNLKKADMVVVRRSEDLSNHQRLVSANVVARHLDPTAGTHHSVDVIDLYKTRGIECRLTSSDITTPSQLMHSVRFNIELDTPLKEPVADLLKRQPFISTTKKFDSNVIFELGRRYGFGGRIYSHAIVLEDILLVTDSVIKGWAFVPQEGNSLLSTLRAYILQTHLPNGDDVFNQIMTDLLRKNW
jgi:glyceraldehyde-3-phosphate dehydrogenase (NAD(P))